MKQRSRIILLSALCALSLSAHAQPLKGQWQGACLNSGRGDSQQGQVTFEETKLYYTVVRHGATDCSAPRLAFAWDADYSTSGANSSNPHLQNIDFTLNGVFITPLSEDSAQQLNVTRYCNYAEWKKNERHEVSAVECGGNRFGPRGFKAYNTYFIREGSLYVNFEASSATPEQRPTTPHGAGMQRQ